MTDLLNFFRLISWAPVTTELLTEIDIARLGGSATDEELVSDIGDGRVEDS